MCLKLFATVYKYTFTYYRITLSLLTATDKKLSNAILIVALIK